MQEIMEELRQLGTLDPAAQNKLMDDLKQTDPALWPLVMQQFRAAIAYKRRAASKIQWPPMLILYGNTLPTTASFYQRQSAMHSVSRLPAPRLRQSRICQTHRPKDYIPAASELPAVSQGVQHAVEEQPAKETANPVVNASYNAPISQEPDDWQGDLSAAIKTLEASTPSNPKSTEELAQQARLRMLYVLAGRRDDALKPIPSAPPAMQEFWSKELYGLAMLLGFGKNARHHSPRRRKQANPLRSDLATGRNRSACGPQSVFLHRDTKLRLLHAV